MRIAIFSGGIFIIKGECKFSVRSWHGAIMLEIGLTIDGRITVGYAKDMYGVIFMLIGCNLQSLLQESAYWYHATGTLMATLLMT